MSPESFPRESDMAETAQPHMNPYAEREFSKHHHLGYVFAAIAGGIVFIACNSLAATNAPAVPGPAPEVLSPQGAMPH